MVEFGVLYEMPSRSRLWKYCTAMTEIFLSLERALCFPGAKSFC